jgi:hypothetical protein
MDPHSVLNDAISRRDTATFYAVLPDRFDGPYGIHPIILAIVYNDAEFLKAILAKEVVWGTILVEGVRLFTIVVSAIAVRNAFDLFSLIISDMAEKNQLEPFIDEAYHFVIMLLGIHGAKKYLRVLRDHDGITGSFPL